MRFHLLIGQVIFPLLILGCARKISTHEGASPNTLNILESSLELDGLPERGHAVPGEGLDRVKEEREPAHLRRSPFMKILLESRHDEYMHDIDLHYGKSEQLEELTSEALMMDNRKVWKRAAILAGRYRLTSTMGLLAEIFNPGRYVESKNTIDSLIGKCTNPQPYSKNILSNPPRTSIRLPKDVLMEFDEPLQDAARDALRNMTGRDFRYDYGAWVLWISSRKN